MCGKSTVGVLEVGPYSPRFLAAADFLGCFTQGNGENAGCLEEAKAPNAGVDGDEEMLEDFEDSDSEAGVDGQGVR